MRSHGLFNDLCWHVSPQIRRESTNGLTSKKLLLWSVSTVHHLLYISIIYTIKGTESYLKHSQKDSTYISSEKAFVWGWFKVIVWSRCRTVRSKRFEFDINWLPWRIFAHYHNGCEIKHNRWWAAVKLSTALISPSVHCFKCTALHLKWRNIKAGDFTVCIKRQWRGINDSAVVCG